MSEAPSSTWAILTFLAKDSLMLNTNAQGRVKAKLIGLITTFLSPIRLIPPVGAVGNSKSALFFHSHADPFGTRSSAEHRQVVSVQLCLLLAGCFQSGWSLVGGGIMDPFQRRGHLILRHCPHRANSGRYDVGCTSIISNHYLQVALPQHDEVEVLNAIKARLKTSSGPQLSLHGDPQGRKVYKVKAESRGHVTQRHKITGLSFSHDKGKSSVGLVIELIKSLNDQGFELAGCVSVFGDQSDLMFYQRPYLESHRSISSDYWALMLKRPQQVLLVNAPDHIQAVVQHEMHVEPMWRMKARHFWDRRHGSIGKVSLMRLIRRCALENWIPLTAYDSLSEHSVLLFKEYAPFRTNPGLKFPQFVSFTCQSKKKLKLDHCHHTGITGHLPNYQGIHPEDPSELLACIRALEASDIQARRHVQDASTLVFRKEPFAYELSSDTDRQMAIFLGILVQIESLGYEFLMCANVSGKFYHADTEKNLPSPHTWFFWKTPQADPDSNPPEFSDEGLPTYDEALELSKDPIYVQPLAGITSWNAIDTTLETTVAID